MNKVQKRGLKKIFKISWVTAGIVLLGITIFSVLKLKFSGSNEGAFFFATSLYSFTVYITITTVFAVTQEIIKRFRQV